MILYITQTCPMVAPVRDALTQRGIPYQLIDVDVDAQAADHLRSLANGFLSVPTLIDAQGRALVEPSLSQLQAWLSPFPVVQPKQPAMLMPERAMLPLLLAIVAGLVLFLGGAQIGQGLEVSPMASLVMIFGGIGLGLLLWLPPLARLMQKAQQALKTSHLRLILAFVFCGGMGVFFGATSHARVDQLLPVVLLVGGCVGAGLWITSRLPTRWQAWTSRLEHLRRWGSLLMMGGFIVSLLLSVVFQNSAWLKPASAGLIVTFGFTLLTMILHTTRSYQTSRPIENASALLGALVGLVMMCAFLFAL